MGREFASVAAESTKLREARMWTVGFCKHYKLVANSGLTVISTVVSKTVMYGKPVAYGGVQWYGTCSR